MNETKRKKKKKSSKLRDDNSIKNDDLDELREPNTLNNSSACNNSTCEDNDCSICYNSDIIIKRKCDSCNFWCCDECYWKIESNSCPVCKHPHFKHSHPETISEDENEFIMGIVEQVGMLYQTQIHVLLAEIQRLSTKVEKQNEVFEKFCGEDFVFCKCGKRIKKTGYKKHLVSKYHIKYCDDSDKRKDDQEEDPSENDWYCYDSDCIIIDIHSNDDND